MSNVAQSFANIVKTNNGLFKSPAQAAFLLSQCSNGEYVTSGITYRSSYALFYTVDEQGVVRVQKQTAAKGLSTEWERCVAGQTSVQDAKEIKRLKRLIKQTERTIAEREAARAAGEFPCDELYQWAVNRDSTDLKTLTEMLDRLVG